MENVRTESVMKEERNERNDEDIQFYGNLEPICSLEVDNDPLANKSTREKFVHHWTGELHLELIKLVKKYHSRFSIGTQATSEVTNEKVWKKIGKKLSKSITYKQAERRWFYLEKLYKEYKSGRISLEDKPECHLKMVGSIVDGTKSVNLNEDGPESDTSFSSLSSEEMTKTTVHFSWDDQSNTKLLKKIKKYWKEVTSSKQLSSSVLIKIKKSFPQENLSVRRISKRWCYLKKRFKNDKEKNFQYYRNKRDRKLPSYYLLLNELLGNGEPIDLAGIKINKSECGEQNVGNNKKVSRTRSKKLSNAKEDASSDSDGSFSAASVFATCHSKWNEELTFKLLELLKKYCDKFRNINIRKKQIYEKVAQEIKQEMNIPLTPVQVDKKFMYLKKTFYKILRDEKCEEMFIPSYYEVVAEILGEKLSITSRTAKNIRIKPVDQNMGDEVSLKSEAFQNNRIASLFTPSSVGKELSFNSSGPNFKWDDEKTIKMLKMMKKYYGRNVKVDKSDISKKYMYGKVAHEINQSGSEVTALQVDKRFQYLRKNLLKFLKDDENNNKFIPHFYENVAEAIGERISVDSYHETKGIKISRKPYSFDDENSSSESKVPNQVEEDQSAESDSSFTLDMPPRKTPRRSTSNLKWNDFMTVELVDRLKKYQTNMEDFHLRKKYDYYGKLASEISELVGTQVTFSQVDKRFQYLKKSFYKYLNEERYHDTYIPSYYEGVAQILGEKISIFFKGKKLNGIRISPAGQHAGIPEDNMEHWSDSGSSEDEKAMRHIDVYKDFTDNESLPSDNETSFIEKNKFLWDDHTTRKLLKGVRKYRHVLVGNHKRTTSRGKEITKMMVWTKVGQKLHKNPTALQCAKRWQYLMKIYGKRDNSELIQQENPHLETVAEILNELQTEPVPENDGFYSLCVCNSNHEGSTCEHNFPLSFRENEEIEPTSLIAASSFMNVSEYPVRRCRRTLTKLSNRERYGATLSKLREKRSSIFEVRERIKENQKQFHRNYLFSYNRRNRLLESFGEIYQRKLEEKKKELNAREEAMKYREKAMKSLQNRNELMSKLLQN